MDGSVLAFITTIHHSSRFPLQDTTADLRSKSINYLGADVIVDVLRSRQTSWADSMAEANGKAGGEGGTSPHRTHRTC
jgi:hypothetical protein